MARFLDSLWAMPTAGSAARTPNGTPGNPLRTDGACSCGNARRIDPHPYPEHQLVALALGFPTAFGVNWCLAGQVRRLLPESVCSEQASRHNPRLQCRSLGSSLASGAGR